MVHPWWRTALPQPTAGSHPVRDGAAAVDRGRGQRTADVVRTAARGHGDLRLDGTRRARAAVVGGCAAVASARCILVAIACAAAATRLERAAAGAAAETAGRFAGCRGSPAAGRGRTGPAAGQPVTESRRRPVLHDLSRRRAVERPARPVRVADRYH